MTTFLEILKEFVLSKNNNNPVFDIKAKRFESDDKIKPFKTKLLDLPLFIKEHLNPKTKKFEPADWTFNLYDIDKGTLLPYTWDEVKKLYSERKKSHI